MSGMATPLADAFGLGAHEVVTLVGGGGKTTTLYRLARELHHEHGQPVIITTTTHIFAPPPDPDLETIIDAAPDADLARCLEALAAGRIPVLGTRLTPDGKLAGVAPEVVDACAACAAIRYVVVEADGSAHKP